MLGAVGCGDRVWAGQAAVAGGPVAAWNRLAHSCSRCQPAGRCTVRWLRPWRLAYPQPVQDRQQQQRLGQLVADPPEHLAAGIRRFRQSRPHQRGLADTRLALDQH